MMWCSKSAVIKAAVGGTMTEIQGQNMWAWKQGFLRGAGREPREEEIPEAEWQWPETDFHARGFTAGQKAAGRVKDGISQDEVTQEALRRVGIQ
jgi:hypothetical protein